MNDIGDISVSTFTVAHCFCHRIAVGHIGECMVHLHLRVLTVLTDHGDTPDFLEAEGVDGLHQSNKKYEVRLSWT